MGVYGDLIIIYPKAYSIYLRGTIATPESKIERGSRCNSVYKCKKTTLNSREAVAPKNLLSLIRQYTLNDTRNSTVTKGIFPTQALAFLAP